MNILEYQSFWSVLHTKMSSQMYSKSLLSVFAHIWNYCPVYGRSPRKCNNNGIASPLCLLATKRTALWQTWTSAHNVKAHFMCTRHFKKPAKSSLPLLDWSVINIFKFTNKNYSQTQKVHLFLFRISARCSHGSWSVLSITLAYAKTFYRIKF